MDDAKITAFVSFKIFSTKWALLMFWMYIWNLQAVLKDHTLMKDTYEYKYNNWK